MKDQENEQDINVIDDYYEFYIKNGHFPQLDKKNKQESKTLAAYYKLMRLYDENFDSLSRDKINLINAIKKKKDSYDFILKMKNNIKNADEESKLYLIAKLEYVNDIDQILLNSFLKYLYRNLDDEQINKIKKIKAEINSINYLCNEITDFIKIDKISPTGLRSRFKFVHDANGELRTVNSAYNYLMKNSKFIDEELLYKLDSYVKIYKNVRHH